MDELSPITMIGGNYRGGTYLLLITITNQLKLKIGKLNKRKNIKFPKGNYVYVGSALSEKGSSSLSSRIIRHLSRSDDKPPHKIKEMVIKLFNDKKISKGKLTASHNKTLFWNIDYLLDQEHVTLTSLLIIRNPLRLEGKIAELLEKDSHTTIIEKGFGANDFPGSTHLLFINHNVDKWWINFHNKIKKLF